MKTNNNLTQLKRLICFSVLGASTIALLDDVLAFPVSFYNNDISCEVRVQTLTSKQSITLPANDSGHKTLDLDTTNNYIEAFTLEPTQPGCKSSGIQVLKSHNIDDYITGKSQLCCDTEINYNSTYLHQLTCSFNTCNSLGKTNKKQI